MCYYPHRSRDSVSPVCKICLNAYNVYVFSCFSPVLKVQFSFHLFTQTYQHGRYDTHYRSWRKFYIYLPLKDLLQYIWHKRNDIPNWDISCQLFLCQTNIPSSMFLVHAHFYNSAGFLNKVIFYLFSF